MKLTTTGEIVAQLKPGGLIVLVDGDDPENGGDLLIAADHVITRAMNIRACFGRAWFAHRGRRATWIARRWRKENATHFRARLGLRVVHSRPESVSMEIASTPSAFVPVVSTAASSLTLPPTPSAQAPPMALSLHVRLSNGVEFDLGKASIDELTTVINVPGRPLSSGSTKIRGCTRHIFEILTIAAA
jgi:hypothetical protein